ncbi:MAG TPA: sigma-54 dependent transcriptional regulator, partial [Vicinamibacterales bacterium]|nr:sigma-54 dependent transcriptional regulator [Vicinamibacterales bacterium]
RMSGRKPSAGDSVFSIFLGNVAAQEYSLLLVPKTDTRCLLMLSVVNAVVEAVTRPAEGVTRIEKLESPRIRRTREGNEIFVSPVILQLLDTAARIAATPITVLITGETGTGKEVFARFIHDASDRRNFPFVPLNCSALPRDLVESQLFGHRKGAFTGASESFDGILKSAERGTVFLDEIGDIPLELQPKVLRFLETGEVLPLGTSQPIRLNVRVIAATNADLAELVRSGRFRSDLYYRLNGIHFELPPLRSRREEIPLLASHLMNKYATEFAKGELTMDDRAVEALVIADWPGNIRQLAMELRRAAALAEPNGVIVPESFSEVIRTPSAERRAVDGGRVRLSEWKGATGYRETSLGSNSIIEVSSSQRLPTAVASLERAMIAHALDQCGGRVDEAARLLGISRKGLFLKRKRYGIVPPRES